MNQIDSRRVCGKADGVPFLNATRPDVTGKCPDGFEVCSSKTTAENTICYEADTVDRSSACPITDILIVENDKAASYTSNGYESAKFNTTTTVVFSKTVNNNLPIT